MKQIDLSGAQFGRLTARERIVKGNPPNNVFWRCTCACGEIKDVQQSNLRNGNTNSCGCYFLEMLHRRKQPDEAIRLSALIRYYKRNAKIRGIKWELSRQFVGQLVTCACEYCGYHADWCGIDRIDNTKGYVFGNCASCCRWCNWGKNERTLVEFKNWVKDLYEILHVR